MGLAGSRKRHKISHDPNNTQWTRNTTTFGHRILASQGWAPGQTLGREEALHARHFTPASASHVRITLRQDNLGLGSKPGSGQGPGECTGLDSFQDLLGRLNGKSEDIIDKERAGRSHVKRSLYAESKYGGWSRFVSAGFLVGEDSMQDQLDTQTSSAQLKSLGGNDETIAIEKRNASREARKEKKSRKRGLSKGGDSPIVAVEVVQDDKLAKMRRKAEKAARRAEKPHKNKEDKIAQTPAEDSTISTVNAVSTSTSMITEPAATTRGFAGGRHAIRARYIMQKKAAMMDVKALNEILMVKS